MASFQTQIQSTLSPDLLSEAINLYITKELGTQVEEHPTKYKFKFILKEDESKQQESQISEVT